MIFQKALVACSVAAPVLVACSVVAAIIAPYSATTAILASFETYFGFNGHVLRKNGEGLNGDKNIEDVLHMVHETTSDVTSSFDADKSTHSLEKNMVSNVPNVNTIVALFVVPLLSIEDLDVLTRKIKAGDYDEIKNGMTSVEWKASMEAIEVEWKKFMANMTSITNVPINEGTGPNEDTPIAKSVSVTKPVSYVSMLENTLYGYFIGRRIAFPVVEYFVRNKWEKYGLTRLMMNSKGFFFFKFDSIKGIEDVLENGP
ncbi:hypothetical protein Tco_1315925 [Tanacetum coccineum]